MPGYNQMNQGYNEQPSVNWGKIAAYGAAATVTAGVVGMSARKLNNSTMATNAKGKAAAAKAKAKKAYEAAKASEVMADASQAYRDAKGWAGEQKPYAAAKAKAKQGWAAIGGWGGLGTGGYGVDYYAGMMQNSMMKNYHTSTTAKRAAMESGIDALKASGAGKKKIEAAQAGLQSFNERSAMRMASIQSSHSAMFGAGKYGLAAGGFFSAAEHAGKSWARAGIAGGRMALAAGAVAALDFLNPFSPGWND